MKENNSYSIGEIAQLAGLTQRTIRYYEEIGLLNSVKRLEGGKRIYTDEDLRRLKFIKRLKILGLSLTEMKELEDIYFVSRSNRAALLKLVDILDKNLNEIEKRQRSLKKLSDEIVEYKKHVLKKLGELKE
ncbi:MAG: MerR family transcriptional regulator [bacterium]